MTALALTALCPSGAAAEECMCIAVSDLGVRAERLLASVEVGPFFSSDGTMLTSRVVELERHFVIERHFGGTPATEILWCWSSDDPRCSPVQPSPDDGSRALRHVPSGMIADHSLRWRESHADALAGGTAALLGPSEGVHARVERPPRA